MRRLDLDLALLFGSSLVLAPLVRQAPIEVALVSAAAVIAARRRGWALALVVIGLTLGGARAATAVASHARAMHLLAARAPGVARCAGEGVVVASPRSVRGATRLEARLEEAACDGVAMPPFRAVLYAEEARPLARGDRIAVVAQLAPPERFANAELGDGSLARARANVGRSGGALDVRRVASGRGPLAWIDRARAHVRERIEATFATDTAPMARALILGESDLDPRDDAAFRVSGLAHLLAVSGMHLVIVVLTMVRVAREVLTRVAWLAARWDVGRGVAVAGIGWAWAYADFAGGTGSALRAAWMLTFVLLARALARRGDGARCFGLSLVATALVDPLAVADLSFVLSAAATGGLLALARPLARAFDARASRIPKRVTESVATTLAATIPCAPVLARFAPTLPLGGVLANLLAVPLGESAALPICILHAFLEPWPRAESGAARVASGALLLVRGVARRFADAHALAIPVPPPSAREVAIVALAAIAWAVLDAGRSRALLLVAALAAMAVAERGVRHAWQPEGELRATFFDVGQGDAALIDLPDGDAVLIDAGGLVGSPVDVGERVIAPALRARRRSHLALVVLSHPHPDHYGGFAQGLVATSVGEVWDTGQGEAEGVSGGYEALLAKARRAGVPVRRPDALCGAPRWIGGARFEVLAPCPAHSPDRGPNDNSLVVRVTYGVRSILFVGDAEREEEADLGRLPEERLRADVLKVGHHGSRTSSSEAFVRAVGPTEAVISVGVRNRFGHPAGATLGTLAAAGVRVHRTDRDGEIVARTDGHALSVTAETGDDL